MRLIRELRSEIKRLKLIIEQGHLVRKSHIHALYPHTKGTGTWSIHTVHGCIFLIHMYILLLQQGVDQPDRGRAMTELFSEDIQRKENQVHM